MQYQLDFFCRFQPRQSGKTTEAIDWVMRDPKNRVLVTASYQQARRLEHLIGDRMSAAGLPPDRARGAVLPATQAIPRLRGSQTIFVVDDIDLVDPVQREALESMPNFSGFTETL